MTGHERVRFQLASLTEAMSSPGVVPHVTVSYDSSSVIQMGIAISDIVMKRTDTQGPYLAIRGMQGLAGERTVSGGMDGKEEGCFCLEDREEKMEQLQLTAGARTSKSSGRMGNYTVVFPSQCLDVI